MKLSRAEKYLFFKIEHDLKDWEIGSLRIKTRAQFLRTVNFNLCILLISKEYRATCGSDLSIELNK